MTKQRKWWHFYNRVQRNETALSRKSKGGFYTSHEFQQLLGHPHSSLFLKIKLCYLGLMIYFALVFVYCVVKDYVSLPLSHRKLSQRHYLKGSPSPRDWPWCACLGNEWGTNHTGLLLVQDTLFPFSHLVTLHDTVRVTVALQCYGKMAHILQFCL